MIEKFFIDLFALLLANGLLGMLCGLMGVILYYKEKEISSLHKENDMLRDLRLTDAKEALPIIHNNTTALVELTRAVAGSKNG